jgi:hypothetical protein
LNLFFNFCFPESEGEGGEGEGSREGIEVNFEGNKIGEGKLRGKKGEGKEREKKE